jgi:hypothetical protein
VIIRSDIMGSLIQVVIDFIGRYYKDEGLTFYAHGISLFLWGLTLLPLLAAAHLYSWILPAVQVWCFAEAVCFILGTVEAVGNLRQHFRTVRAS